MTRSSQNRPGYIRNPWSKENDGIHIDTFFKRISQDAGKRCGCYYEVYEKMCMDSLLNAIARLETLNMDDAQYVKEMAMSRGYELSHEGQQATERAYNETMSEIRREQE